MVKDGRKEKVRVYQKGWGRSKVMCGASDESRGKVEGYKSMRGGER